jgi:hypothetical protein
MMVAMVVRCRGHCSPRYFVPRLNCIAAQWQALEIRRI